MTATIVDQTGLEIIEIHILLPPQILRIKSCATRTSWSWTFIITTKTLIETEIGTRAWEFAVRDMTMHLYKGHRRTLEVCAGKVIECSELNELLW